MKSLVISGGGNKGAWGGGVAHALNKFHQRDYKLYIGTSTGALLNPLIAQHKFEELRKAYTSIDENDIYKVNPFDKKGNIKPLNAFWRMFKNIFTSTPSLGDSSKLKETIQDFFPETYFKSLKNTEKEVIPCVSNLTLNQSEYYSSKDLNYKDFVDYTYASACSPVFMSLVRKNGYDYTDGGIIDHVPVQYAIDRGADEIDVIIHRQKEANKEQKRIKNPFEFLKRTTEVMSRQISEDDVIISKLQANEKDVILNFYYTPHKLTDNSLIFDKDQMAKWWDLGYYEIADDIVNKQSFKLTKKNNIIKK